MDSLVRGPGSNNDDSSIMPEGGGGGKRGKPLPKLPVSTSDNSMVSYTREDLDTANGAEITNVKNILEDNSLSNADKNSKVLRMYAAECNELAESKQKKS